MKPGSAKHVRCAIYTRVSTDQGLDQDFNSLDAQYDASEAYIRSQAHAGWTMLRAKYDDGGFSGGNTDRPALQRLLDDVRAGKVEVIVVYKVDRLTRSLADFAKLVELFDQHGVSFVSVTQQFNTTTSMGRLTLNVLLSFAQFEREVTSERIRDKIAASKRKGLWVGGKAPLGYVAKDRKVIVVAEQAERVRVIFRAYLKLGSLNALMADLRRRGIVTKVQTLRTGRTIGGIPFTRGPLSYLLRNRFYIGEVVYKGEILPGGQAAIIDRDLFEAVQAKLAEQQNNTITSRSASYYVSLPLLHGQSDQAGSVSRVPATEVEGVVAAAARRELKDGTGMSERDLIRDHVSRVEVHSDHLLVTFNPAAEPHASKGDISPEIIRVPWQKPPSKRRREIMVPHSATPGDTRPIRAEARSRLVSAIARGRSWLNDLMTGTAADVDAIAVREGCSPRKVNMTISLAFLAPGLVKAAIEGRLPHGMGVARLVDMPPEWSRQYQMLGLPSA